MRSELAASLLPFPAVRSAAFILLALSALQASAQGPALATADSLYAHRYKLDNVRRAVTILSADSGYEALWRLARCNWYLGDRAAKSKEKLAYFDKGKKYAEHAVTADPRGADGHFWHASLLGAAGQERGILNSLFMIGPMKEALDKCLSLDAKYADAHDVLARLLWKVPGPPISIGNRKKAQQEAALAAQYHPNDIDHWLHLGQIAIDNKDYAAACPALRKALSLPDNPEDPPTSRKEKGEAAQALEEIPAGACGGKIPAPH